MTDAERVEKQREYNRNWYRAHREYRLTYQRTYKHAHSTKVAAQATVRTRNRKQQVFDLLGGQCARCGMSDVRVLQVDHINGGGCKERKSSGGGESFYNRILRGGAEKYQLLCANCNWIKRVESGEKGCIPVSGRV